MKLLVFEDLEREITLFERLEVISRHRGERRGGNGLLDGFRNGLAMESMIREFDIMHLTGHSLYKTRNYFSRG